MSEPADDLERRWTPSALTDLRGRDTAAVRPVVKAPQAKAPADATVATPTPGEIRQQAYDKGFAEGLAAGRAQAERIAAEMTTLLKAMAMPFHDMDAVLLRELLELTERVVGAVLGREHELGVDLEPILAEALAALGSASVPVEVVLHPADALLCRGAGMFDSEQFILVEDNSLDRGGLQLRAGSSFVDASVAARLETAIASIRSQAGLPEPEPAPAAESAATTKKPTAGAITNAREGAGENARVKPEANAEEKVREKAREKAKDKVKEKAKDKVKAKAKDKATDAPEEKAAAKATTKTKSKSRPQPKAAAESDDQTGADN